MEAEEADVAVVVRLVVERIRPCRSGHLGVTLFVWWYVARGLGCRSKLKLSFGVYVARRCQDLFVV